MSIPLDRLYHYIESIAREIREDNVVIYRFYPHGSKKVEDLLPLSPYSWSQSMLLPHLICNDQEPLDYDCYRDMAKPLNPFSEILKKYLIELPDLNLRKSINIYDHCILIHSEQRSTNVAKYNADKFIPVYYWSHAIIALDWFRFAQYVTQKKNVKKQFLIYNRAWSGTREYRLKFADLLIKLGLVDSCHMRVSPIDSELGKHYDLHHFKNNAWRPNNVVEKFFPISHATSSYSADFDETDYEITDIEVVLETLFDDGRLHLTEKILRPIALGQPFILASTHLSLEYLRRYGFKTFGHIWDERYDQTIDPEERLMRIVDLMRDISTWTPMTRERKIAQAQMIADYNRKHFFSKEFFDQVKLELKENMSTAFDQIEILNTGQRYIDIRKQCNVNEEIKQYLTQADSVKSKQDIIKVLSKAREYYMRS